MSCELLRSGLDHFDNESTAKRVPPQHHRADGVTAGDSQSVCRQHLSENFGLFVFELHHNDADSQNPQAPLSRAVDDIRCGLGLGYTPAASSPIVGHNNLRSAPTSSATASKSIFSEQADAPTRMSLASVSLVLPSFNEFL